MIPYSLNNNSRNMALTLIVLISVLINFILKNLIESLQFITDFTLNFQNSTIGSIIPILHLISETALPGFLICFVIYKLYVKHIWKYSFLYRFHHVPNLNGEWHGEIYKRKPNGDIYNRRQVTVIIKQDWEKIKITTQMLDSPVHSFCECTVAAMDTCFENQKLKYSYENKSNATKSLYVGYNELNIEKNKICGSYITTKPSDGIFNIEK